MQRIPLAFLLTSFDPGGTERQMTELIARLDPTRFAVHVACFRREGRWLPRVEETAASITEFRLSSFTSPATLGCQRRFAEWCHRKQIAVVQACDFYANVFALPAAAFARVPLRLGARRDLILPTRSSGQHRLQRWAYRFAHRVIANSRAAAAQATAEGVPEHRVVVIPNGIDVSAYPRRQVTVAARPTVGRSALRTVTTVANLRSEKGHDVLIAAAARVCREQRDVRFQLVGDGPMRGQLEAQAAAANIAAQVEFVGHREDVASLLAGSDLFVLPSRTEAFPNALVEAMAAGLPCIATAIGGNLELIESPHNGRLVPVGDVDALGRTISELLRDAPAAARLGAAARDTVESRYSFARMVTSFEEVYLTSLAGSRFPIPALHAR